MSKSLPLLLPSRLHLLRLRRRLRKAKRLRRVIAVLPVVNLNAIAALVVVVGRMGPKTNEVVLANTIGELRNQAQRRMMRQAET